MVKLALSPKQESILARLLKETSLEKMEKSPCVIPLQPNSENTEVEELRSTYIPIIVSSTVFCPIQQSC